MVVRTVWFCHLFSDFSDEPMKDFWSLKITLRIVAFFHIICSSCTHIPSSCPCILFHCGFHSAGSPSSKCYRGPAHWSRTYYCYTGYTIELFQFEFAIWFVEYALDISISSRTPLYDGRECLGIMLSGCLGWIMLE